MVRWVPLLLVADVAFAQPPMPRVHTWARDDLTHHTAKFAPLLVDAKDCIPKHPDLSVAIDTFDGKLVACAQAMTRQGGSVFSNLVSFGCWDVDVANGKLAWRGDAGRAFFRCQDGCPGVVAYGSGAVSYDGTKMIVGEEGSTLTIYERKSKNQPGAQLGVIASAPAGLDPFALYVGSTLVGDTAAYDETGKELVTFPAGDARVVDDTRVIVVDGKRGTLLDLATNKTSKVQLETAYTSGPVAFDGKAYAIAGRALFVLDARFKRKQTISLPACRARSGSPRARPNSGLP